MRRSISHCLQVSTFLCATAVVNAAYAFEPCIIWDCEAVAGNCRLDREGDSFFKVNGTWLPTYTVEGYYRSAFVAMQQCTAVPGGYECHTVDVLASENRFQSCFSPALLVDGLNTVEISGRVTYGSRFTRTHHDVSLRKPNGAEEHLFTLTSEGETFSAERAISLDVADIHPQLARVLDDLRTAVADIADDGTRANASWERERRNRDLLNELAQRLEQFFGRPLTEVNEDEFRAVFTGDLVKYREEFVELFERVRQGLRQQQDAVDDVLADADASLPRVLQDVVADGDYTGDSSPLDDALYSDLDADMPSLEAPELSDDATDDEGETDAAWQKYADDVIAELDACIDENGRVTARARFLNIAQTWREAVEQVRETFDLRQDVPLSDAEAFSRSVQRVAAYISLYVDDVGWFRDSTVSMTVRDAIALHVEPYDAQRAAGLRYALNLWLDEEVTPEQETVMQWIPALAALYQAAAQGYADRMAVDLYADETIHWGVAAARVGVSFTPFGDAVDVCEAVTGLEDCLPGGRQLSTFERVAAGLGSVIGNRYVWSYVGTAVASAVVVTRKLTRIEDALSSLPRQVRESLLTRFTAETLDAVSDLPGDRIVALAADLGDDVLEKLARQLPGSEIDNIATGITPAFLAKMAADLNGAEIKSLHDVLGKGSLRNLAVDWTGSEIRMFRDSYGAVAARNLAKDLTGAEIVRVQSLLQDGLMRTLAERIRGRALRQLADLDGVFRRGHFGGSEAYFDAYVAGTKGAALKALDTVPYDTTATATLRGRMAELGFARHTGSVNGAQEIWFHADHSVVRMKLEPSDWGVPGRPHFDKEVSKAVGTWETSDIAFKVTDTGVPTPKGTSQTEQVLRAFYREKAGAEAEDATIDALMDFWGKRTHLWLQ